MVFDNISLDKSPNINNCRLKVKGHALNIIIHNGKAPIGNGMAYVHVSTFRRRVGVSC